MKNQPKKIYLQLGLEEENSVIDFNTLATDFVTWESNRIYKDDLEYISSNFISARIKELEEEKFDTTTKHGVHDFNVNSAVINGLKQLLR